ncbi:MAG: alpha/beta fold hydrolase [Acidobacteria bacterium]|nr:alpha/beta fold hydrolase [Acidobacteriota bacterium]
MNMLITSVPTPWFLSIRSNPQVNLKLFCFPYAGGGASIFHSWPKSLPTNVEVCAIHLPGRGPRMMEKPFTRMPPLIHALTQALLPHLDKPFAFFGHSMGALVSFELARHLQKQYNIIPLHLFISGARAPQIRSRARPIHGLPKRDFVRTLRGLDETPRELLESSELVQLMLPTLRADFAVCETYTYASESPLSCSISALGGLRDRRVSRAHLEAWRCQTSSSFSLQMLPSDHFFLQTAQHLFLPLLSQELRRLTSEIT